MSMKNLQKHDDCSFSKSSLFSAGAAMNKKFNIVEINNT